MRVQYGLRCFSDLPYGLDFMYRGTLLYRGPWDHINYLVISGEKKKCKELGPANLCCIQGCESSDFNLISDFFALHKTPFQTFNALKSTSFQAFQIISDFFARMLSHPCISNLFIMRFHCSFNSLMFSLVTI